MAVARMLKVTVLMHTSALDDVVDALQRAGVLEVTTQPFELPDAEIPQEDTRLRELEELSADAGFVCDFLGRYRKPEVAFSAFISEKFHLSVDEFEHIEADTRFQRVYTECVSLADRLASGERETARLSSLATDLEPWKDFHLQISRWKGTKHVVLFTGTVPATQGPEIRQQLRDAVAEVTVEELGPVGTRQAWVVMAHRDRLAEVRSALALTSFAEVSFPALSEYPAEELARARARIAEIAAEREQLIERAVVLAGEYYSHAITLREALLSRLAALDVRKDFGLTERTVVATGWVRATTAGQLQATLAQFEDDLDITLSEPTEDDQPPVELDNPRWLKPFEVLTDLYGRPSYREVDPTPLLAPFFLTFFSLCIGDVGYGAMLIAGAYLIKTRLDVAPGVKRFMDLLMFGGAGAMVVGVLFASYFAIDYADLPRLLQFRVLDPLGNLQGFLVLTIGLGVTQVFFGVLVAAWDAWRRGDPLGAVSEQVSTVFMFAMIAFAAFSGQTWAIPVALIVTMLLQGRAIEAAIRSDGLAAWDRAAGVLWVLVVLGWTGALAFGGPSWATWAFLGYTVLGVIGSKAVRGATLGLLGGAYAVYGMSAFLGDILSYTRLAALGLSGTLVGYVFNLLTKMVWGGASGLFRAGGLSILGGIAVVLAAVAIFAVGHTFNVVINLLGAFVHPARLQFVEFFSKFYEGGGRAFAPFRFASKSVVLHAGPARQEGGTGS